MAKKLGQAIRDARNQNALTQQELADKLSVTQGTIHNWEAGRHDPSEDDMDKLQVETVLIKFLKSNAIINKQPVERDEAL
jgi:transcriptional regulator with XRE-family HTH domain